MATTLVTFIFDCPVAARSVELLGSWDNFEKPYTLKKDSRRSQRTWSGCFTFQNIICDGDPRNPVPGRNGALRAGGLYWYYYKVDDDEEHYDSCKPSTSVCPLLPGQRVNILEVPMEAGGTSCPQSSPGFSLNPKDRYLTPVPPKPPVSSSVGDFCKEPYKVPIYPHNDPHSKHAESLASKSHPDKRYPSTSPRLKNRTILSDLKDLPGPVAARKRSASEGRPGKARLGPKSLGIGAPVLISTTAEEVRLVPLPSGVSRTNSSRKAHVASRMKDFSPLGSHPVMPKEDFGRGTSADKRNHKPSRPRSHNPSLATPKLVSSLGRNRANSAGTRRTKEFCSFANELWVSSPRLPSCREMVIASTQTPAQSTRMPLDPVSQDDCGRPISRRGHETPKALGGAPLSQGLPALPHYQVPAALFTYTSTATSPVGDKEDPESVADAHAEGRRRRQPEGETLMSDASIAESDVTSSPTSDQSGAPSPTFSWSTSASSHPQLSPRVSVHGPLRDRWTGRGRCTDVDEICQVTETLAISRLASDTTAAPKGDIHEWEVRKSVTSSRRRAAYLEYPSLDVDSQAKMPVSASESTFAHGDALSPGRLDDLMDDFAFLGEVVH